MAALAALDTGVVTALSLSRAEVAFRLAEREAAHLRGLAPDPALATLPVQLAAYVTLCGGVSAEQALVVAKQEGQALGLEYPNGPGALVNHLRDVWPGPEGGIAPIRPDLLGEAFLLGAWQSANTPVVRRAARTAPGAVAACLVRTAQDFVGKHETRPIQWLKTMIESGTTDDVGLLFAIAEAMPQHTLSLRELAAEVTGLLVDRLAHLRGRTSTEQDVRWQGPYAALLNNLSVQQSALGRREAALASIEEAVQIRRELVRQRSVFVPGLAQSLGVRGRCCEALGNVEAGSASVAEALELLSPHFGETPSAFRDLALVLLRDYISRAGTLHIGPDLPLLEPYLSYFSQFSNPEQ